MAQVLGISAYYHDSAAVLVGDSGVVGAMQEERLTRVKGDSAFPSNAIRALLSQHNVAPGDLDLVSFYEHPRRKLRRILTTQVAESPLGWRQFQDVVMTMDVRPLSIRADLAPLGLRAVQLRSYAHHQSHAASAFFSSPFDSAAVLTIDGVGEWATTTIARGVGLELIPMRQIRFPHSLGLLYATFTAYCGFKVNSGEYKLMGLAPFGKPIYARAIREEVARIGEDGSMVLNMKYFDFTRGLGMFSVRLPALFGHAPRLPEEQIERFHCDIAASIQSVLEYAVRRLVRHALDITGESALCLAGGVALNCVANGRIFDIVDASRIFIQPAAGDAGGALGCALLGYRDVVAKQCSSADSRVGVRAPMRSAFLGTEYQPERIEAALRSRNMKWTRFDSRSELLKATVDSLEGGRIVGWFQGRMEFGPRALGARSILADPRAADMQRRLNVKIKQRESFRPFAPVVLAERASNWFEWPANALSPFMLFTASVRSVHLRDCDNSWPESGLLTEWVARLRSIIPAVTHVDNSARLQTVQIGDPLRDLLEAFEARTGTPILVNTSLNVRGEPIVESPADAIQCLLITDLDCLVIGPYFVDKSCQDPAAVDEARSTQRIWELD